MPERESADNSPARNFSNKEKKNKNSVYFAGENRLD